MADTEIWKDIEGYEGIYQVSSLGRVRSLDREIVVLRGGNYYSKTQKGCIITNQKDTMGYNQVQLHQGTHKVPHKLNRKPVVQYSKDGIFIKKWDSAEEAAAALSLTKSNIQSVAGHRPHSYTAGGYKWEYI